MNADPAIETNKLEKFLDDPKRRKNEFSEMLPFQEILVSVMNWICLQSKQFNEDCLEKIKDSPFLEVLNNANKGKKTHSTTKNKSCDLILAEYVEHLQEICNQDYFIFGLKFLFLMRGCLNKYKNVELINRREILQENIPLTINEYTEYFNADQIPDICNEFVSEFLENSEFFGMNEVEKNEIIEIIQHLCYWLFKKGYTSSKLSLVN